MDVEFDDVIVPLTVNVAGDVGTVTYAKWVRPNEATESSLIALSCDTGIWLLDPASLECWQFAPERNLPGLARAFTIEAFAVYGNPTIPPMGGGGGGFEFEGQPLQEYSLGIGISPRMPSLHRVYEASASMFAVLDTDGDAVGDVGFLYPGQ